VTTLSIVVCRSRTFDDPTARSSDWFREAPLQGVEYHLFDQTSLPEDTSAESANDGADLLEKHSFGASVRPLLDTLSGAWFLILGSAQSMSPDSVFATLQFLSNDPTIDAAYTDESVAGPTGLTLHRKPAWSPHRFLHDHYTGSALALRRATFERLGGFANISREASMHQYILRLMADDGHIEHIPHVLIHSSARPAPPSNETESGTQQPVEFERSVRDLVAARGETGAIVVQRNGRFNIRRASSPPELTVVIPTAGRGRGRDESDVPHIVSLLHDTKFRASVPNEFEVLVVVDDTTPEMVIDELVQIEDDFAGVRLITPPPRQKGFNFAERINWGVSFGRFEYLLVLNDDVSVIDEDWVDRLLDPFWDPAVGVTGPMLLFENGVVQCAGISCNHGATAHIAYGALWSDQSDTSVVHCTREVSAVTGAALATRRSIFDLVGGLSTSFPVYYNDIDYCFKAWEAGKSVVFTPESRLIHFESASISQINRTQIDDSIALDLLRSKWPDKLLRDPFDSFLITEGVSL
jgi:O-antigen biosynthesis protein